MTARDKARDRYYREQARLETRPDGTRYLPVTPWRCAACRTPIRPGRGDPCKCVTPDKPSNPKPGDKS